MSIRGRTFLTTLFLAILFCALPANGQDADKGAFTAKPDPDDQPRNVKEMLVKMQIDQAKKQYDEMLDRAQQALKISEELEHTFVERNSLTRSDIEKLDSLEKLVKKIRGELGGEDGDDLSDEVNRDKSPPSTFGEGLKSLQSLTSKLVDELKKTSRFGISAVAIESSNAVIKVVRFLRLTKQK